MNGDIYNLLVNIYELIIVFCGLILYFNETKNNLPKANN